ncbi:MAG TPA: hypothetical protein VGX68_09650 [Thermoanaerobaculia bacterium]|jgi:hypothetical protein|nr:hypothetical protein [Thermoanaerobaculia bacterium]
MTSKLSVSSLAAGVLAASLLMAPFAAGAQEAQRAAALPLTLERLPGEPQCPNSGSLVTAHVIALNQQLTLNRMGAEIADGWMYALARDVFPKGTTPANETEANSCRYKNCTAGNVQLRSTKRPRPPVLRVNQGQCLQIVFKNLLASTLDASQPAAAIHVQGVEWVSDSNDDGAWVGTNANSTVGPNGTHTYTLYARHEGDFLMYSGADPWSNLGTGDGGQLSLGLFGAVEVEPAGAEWYRSQVTEQDLCYASGDGFYDPASKSCRRTTPDNLPLIKYRATYPDGVPILNMLNCLGQNPNGCPKGGEIVHADLTAVITGRTANGQPGNFPTDAVVRPVFNPAYALPERLQPYREVTIIYHEVFSATQAWKSVYGNLNGNGTGADNFAFNYGAGGIGSEILANRFGTGPMGKCASCKYEEFFLTSWAVGDPAMVVDHAADEGCTASGGGYDCSGHTPATIAYFPDDPSNVYHSYIADHIKFRVLHAGVDLHHLHHQHAHQWLHSPDTPTGDYTDSQSLGPGSAFTMEMVYNGSGNVNQTVGDSIFHCHFYPHFAGGMWSMWRVHDVFEPGTELGADGRPKMGAIPSMGPVTTARALPDGEIQAGTPIPALVPLPTRPMAPMPAKVLLAKQGKEILVSRTLPNGTTEYISNLQPGVPDAGWKNPGYPFFIASRGGERASHPPLDFAYACSDNGQACRPALGDVPADLSACGSPSARCNPLDGGLPRHLITSGTTDSPPTNIQDFSKTLETVAAQQVPEEGTLIERVAMRTHAQRFHDTKTPEGAPAKFTLNGLPPTAGAPYADPCINYSPQGGQPAGLKTRRYRAAAFQLDVSFNKEKWHYPQERILSLWGDVKPTLDGTRAPEPLFFRSNSGECIEYTHANLVPNVWELDDFEVRTPTDILGQHIHLVKFDVTSSDGATNGFNYEDGTFAPNEVVERIFAIRRNNGCKQPDARDGTFTCPLPKYLPFFGPGPGGQWMGAQATIQRWYADPLFDGATHNPPMPGAQDRTLRTVFTHDHYGPSTHQQAGLYAGLVIEPRGSNWFKNTATSGVPQQLGGVDANGNPLILSKPKGYDGNAIPDGGPTSWQAVIVPPDPKASFREFLLEMQDTTLTYAPFTFTPPSFLAKGFCADSPSTSCTPATNKNFDQPVTGCKAGVACIAYGFCSTNLQQQCTPSPWATPEQIPQQCGQTASGYATCNLIPGIPGVTESGFYSNPPVSPLVWGTTPIGTAAGIGPEIITLSHATNNFSVNYRNEPLFPRVNSGGGTANAADMAFAYSSIDRGSGLGGDPATPLLRAYAGDDVQVRVLTGAHINPHNFTIHDVKWLMEPSMVDSGWRNSLVMGISEHFEQVFRLPTWVWNGKADYLWMGGAAAVEQASGNWGLLRAYGTKQSDLPVLAQNQDPTRNAGIGVCPQPLQPPFTTRNYTVVALTAQQALGSGKSLVYNDRASKLVTRTKSGDETSQLYQDPNAVLYYKLEDLNCKSANPPTLPCTAKSPNPQPLVLRANAGDCIQVAFYNLTDLTTPLAGADSPDPIPAANCNNQQTCTSKTSLNLGLHPQLVTFNATAGSAFNAGTNPVQTVGPKEYKGYQWYAGNIDGSVVPPRYIPIEFGAANLLPSDVFNHFQHGTFGTLVIEPLGATGWKQSDGTTAVVTSANGTFREFVLAIQDGLQSPLNPPALGPVNLNAVNYRTEPLNNSAQGVQVRWCGDPSVCQSTTITPSGDVACVLSTKASGADTPLCCTTFLVALDGTTSCAACAACGAVRTPTLQACAGEQVRFRLLHAGGANTNEVFELYGHVWAETPYTSTGPGCIPPTTQTNLYSSSIIDDRHRCTPSRLGKNGFNARFAPFADVPDSLTDWQGSRMGHGPGNHFDVLVNRAGGANAVPGSYLYRSYPAMQYRLGPWGIFQVLSAADAQKAGLQCLPPGSVK